MSTQTRRIVPQSRRTRAARTKAYARELDRIFGTPESRLDGAKAAFRERTARMPVTHPLEAEDALEQARRLR